MIKPQQHDEAALAKWQKRIRIKKILRRCALAALLLAFCLFGCYLWNKVGDLRFGFASSMAKWTSGIIRLFGSVPDNLAEHFETAFIVAFGVVVAVLFVFLILGGYKLKRYIIEHEADEFAGRFENIGLTNERGGTLEYLGKQDDPNTIDGVIYTFADSDVDYGMFNDPIIMRGLRNIFHGFVRPDFGKVYGVLQFFVKPSAKANCVSLTSKNTWIVRHMNAAGIFGAPGSGKTFGLAFLMWLYCLDADTRNIDMEFVLCDQKLTFAQKLGVEASPSFYYGPRVLDGLENAVATLDKVKLNPDGKIRVYVLDEMITFLERLERKQADRAKSLLATLVFEGREYGFKVILAGQSSHAERFSAGVRDSLTSKFFFGSPSENEKRMLFPSDVGLMDAHNTVGEGYYHVEAVMPHVERFSIKDAVPDFAEIGALVRRHMRESSR